VMKKNILQKNSINVDYRINFYPPEQRFFDQIFN
jgi:hypothetical protein